MLLQTEKLMNKSWQFLQKQGALCAFEDRDAFEDTFKTLGEVDEVKQSYFCRKSALRPFEPGNVQIVNVHNEFDINKVVVPKVKI